MSVCLSVCMYVCEYKYSYTPFCTDTPYLLATIIRTQARALGSSLLPSKAYSADMVAGIFTAVIMGGASTSPCIPMWRLLQGRGFSPDSPIPLNKGIYLNSII